MVASGSGGGEPSDMPGIRQLLQDYVDRSGDSTRVMAAKVDYAVSHQRFAQLLNEPTARLPYERKVISALGKLLSLPDTTIVKAFLVDLGLPVDDRWSRLAQMLPPDVDQLDGQDIDAVTYLVRRLVEARKAATNPAASVPVPPIGQVRDLHPPAPNLSVVAARNGTSQGKTKREQQDEDADKHED